MHFSIQKLILTLCDLNHTTIFSHIQIIVICNLHLFISGCYIVIPYSKPAQLCRNKPHIQSVIQWNAMALFCLVVPTQFTGSNKWHQKQTSLSIHILSYCRIYIYRVWPSCSRYSRPDVGSLWTPFFLSDFICSGSGPPFYVLISSFVLLDNVYLLFLLTMSRHPRRPH